MTTIRKLLRINIPQPSLASGLPAAEKKGWNMNSALYDYNEDGEAVAALNGPYPIRATWDDCDHFYLDWHVVPPYFGITETSHWVDRNGRWQEGTAPSSIVFKLWEEFNDFSHSTEVE